MAFEWAEHVTLVGRSGVPEPLLEGMRACFSDVEIVDLTFIVAAMNGWNRLAIAFGRRGND